MLKKEDNQENDVKNEFEKKDVSISLSSIHSESDNKIFLNSTSQNNQSEIKETRPVKNELEFKNKSELSQERFRKYEQLNEDIQNIKELQRENFIVKNCKKLQSWTNNTATEKYITSLLQIQNFKADSDSVWVAKFSLSGKYLATGGKSGVLKIWEILSLEDTIDSYDENGLRKYINFMEENAFRIYTEHTKDIIDISWSNKNYNLLVTASLDHSAILWDINKEASILKYKHNGIVTCVSFYPNTNILFPEVENEKDDIFITGCFDKIIRVWNIKNKEGPFLYINVIEYVTAICFFPEGDNLAVGTSDGKVMIYDCARKLRYSYSFNCRNKGGKYSDGRKITNILFKNKNEVFITTNDSRIRLVKVSDGNILKKFKGYINEEAMLRADYDEIYGRLIAPSDDGYLYIWGYEDDNNQKIFNYEYFKPFDKKEYGNVISALFTYDTWLDEYNHKIQKISQNFFTKGIIICSSSKGYISIILNYEFLNI